MKDVGENVKAGLDAAKAIASTAIESLVQIHSMCFQSALTEAAKACVGFKIDATFFKTKKVKFDTQGCLDVSFAKTIAQAISDKLYPGISAMKGKIDQLKAKFGLIEQEKDKVESTADEVDEIDDDDSKSSRRDDVVWTEEEEYYRKLAYEQLPRFTLLDEATLKAFEVDTSSMKARADDAMARAIIPDRKTTGVLKKREQISGPLFLVGSYWSLLVITGSYWFLLVLTGSPLLVPSVNFSNVETSLAVAEIEILNAGASAVNFPSLWLEVFKSTLKLP